MSDIAQQISPWRSTYQGEIIEVLQRQMQSGEKTITFEKASRSPGTRLIIVDQENQKILLTKEFRYEVKDFDYRLPGGKVCNSLKDFHKLQKNGDIDTAAKTAAINEAKQEAGIDPKKINLFYISKSGGPTIEWDLYYFVIDDYQVVTQNLEFGENISIEWLTYSEAISLALSDKMKEDRSVGVLMKYFRSIGKI